MTIYPENYSASPDVLVTATLGLLPRIFKVSNGKYISSFLISPSAWMLALVTLKFSPTTGYMVRH